MIQAQNLADVLTGIFGTKLVIGPPQIRPLVAVAAIFQNGRQRLVKPSKSMKSHAIMDIIEILITMRDK